MAELHPLSSPHTDPTNDIEIPDFLPWLPQRAVGARGWTAARQRTFLAALARLGSVRLAAAAAGKSARSAYQLRAKPGAEHFAVAWDAMASIGLDRACDIAMDAATVGRPVVKYRRGKPCGIRFTSNECAAVAVISTRVRRDRAEALEDERYRLERWEIALRRREMDLDDRESGAPRTQALRSAEAHELWVRALAAEKRAEELRANRALIAASARRARAAAAEARGPRIRSL